MTYLRQPKTAPSGPAASARHLRRVASVVFGLTLVLAAATLVTANNLATSGKLSQDIDREIRELQAQNSKLKSENAELTSVSRVYEQALTLGFTSPKALENLTKVPAVALLGR